MVTVPKPKDREIITRAPFVDEELVGEMVAHLVHGNAEIDVEIKPFESEPYPRIGLSVKEARRLAAALMEIADVAQAAMWTPGLLAEVRERYLPGATDAQIIEQLEALADRLDGGFELRAPDTLFTQHGQALTAAVHGAKVERVSSALAAAGVALTDLDSVVGDLRKIYAATQEDDQ